MSIKKETMAFHYCVLGILGPAFLIGGIIYLFKAEWFVGISLIIADFFLTKIYLKLKHFSPISNIELSKTLELDLLDKEPKVEEPNNHLSFEEKEKIMSTMQKTIIISIIVSSVIFFHYDFKWYFAIPLATIIGALFPFLLFRFGLLIVAKS